MGLTPVDANGYAQMLWRMLPPGRLFREAISKLFVMLTAAADELVRVHNRAADLWEESDPRTATELLPEHESEYGVSGGGSLDERRLRVLQVAGRPLGFRPSDLQNALALALDLVAADVVVIERSRAFAIAVNDDRAIYQFFVYRDPGLPGIPNIAQAQATLDDMAHSHTRGDIIESNNFLCDDPFSLCDRDVLGA